MQFNVPDFKGKTVSEANALVASSGITITVSGNDYDIIESQDKVTGTKSNVGDTITLISKAVVTH